MSLTRKVLIGLSLVAGAAFAGPVSTVTSETACSIDSRLLTCAWSEKTCDVTSKPFGLMILVR